MTRCRRPNSAHVPSLPTPELSRLKSIPSPCPLENHPLNEYPAAYAPTAIGIPSGGAGDPPWSNSPAIPARPAPPPVSRGSCTSTAAAMSGPRASADLRALRGRPPHPAAPARFPDVRRPAPECGSSPVHRVRSHGVPGGSSPAPNRSPTTRARRHHSQSRPTRLPPTAGDYARRAPARPRCTCRRWWLPTPGLASRCEYDRYRTRWQSNSAHRPYTCVLSLS